MNWQKQTITALSFTQTGDGDSEYYEVSPALYCRNLDTQGFLGHCLNEPTTGRLSYQWLDGHTEDNMRMTAMVWIPLG